MIDRSRAAPHRLDGVREGHVARLMPFQRGGAERAIVEHDELMHERHLLASKEGERIRVKVAEEQCVEAFEAKAGRKANPARSDQAVERERPRCQSGGGTPYGSGRIRTKGIMRRRPRGQRRGVPRSAKSVPRAPGGTGLSSLNGVFCRPDEGRGPRARVVEKVVENLLRQIRHPVVTEFTAGRGPIAGELSPARQVSRCTHTAEPSGRKSGPI